MTNEGQFSVIIIPDTQDLAEEHADIYNKMSNWIVENRSPLNLQCVLHLGDVVNDINSENEVRHAKEALEKIDEANIPMLIAIGNHDYDNLLADNRNAALFNEHFGLHRFENKGWAIGMFEENKVENMYMTMTINQRKFLFVTLEFGPRDEVIEWFDKIVSQHEDHNVILITHSYMFINGKRTSIHDHLHPKTYVGTADGNTGDELWEKSIKHHHNMKAIFSGHHVPGNISYRVDLGEKGNPIFQSFQNWQMEPLGGEGRIRVFTINPNENTISLNVYNPLQEKFEKELGYNIQLEMNPKYYKKSLQFVHNDTMGR